MAQSFTSQHWSLVAIELLLIIAGILAALSIDDWVQERENRRTEQVYLGLRVSGTGLSLATKLMDQTNQLKMAIEQELRDLG